MKEMDKEEFVLNHDNNNNFNKRITETNCSNLSELNLRHFYNGA